MADDIQMTIRLEREFHAQCKERSDCAGQTLAEWIRRAMREKMDREDETPPPKSPPLSDEELEKLILRTVERELKRMENEKRPGPKK